MMITQDNFSRNSGSIVVLALIFALIVLLGGGIVYQNKKINGLLLGNRPSPTDRPLPTSIPTLAPSPESTEEPTKETMTIKVFFGNEKKNPGIGDCRLVYPVNRTVLKTKAVAKAALNELFKGPTEKEKAQNYVSFFSEKTKSILKSVKIEKETAYVNLVDIRPIVPNASTSCGSAEFLAEIETTLKQFPTVKKVILAIEGKPEAFYEWLQLGCSAQDGLCDEKPFLLE